MTSPSSPALTLTGTLSSSMDLTGTWTFANSHKVLNAASPGIGEYTLRFSSDGLQPVDQIVHVTLGTKGYRLNATLPSNFGPYPSSGIVNFDTFTVKVLDGGGNFLGTADRFNASFNATVTRTIIFTCKYPYLTILFFKIKLCHTFLLSLLTQLFYCSEHLTTDWHHNCIHARRRSRNHQWIGVHCSDGKCLICFRFWFLFFPSFLAHYFLTPFISSNSRKGPIEFLLLKHEQ